MTVINDDSDGDSCDGVYFVSHLDEDWRAHKWVEMILIVVVILIYMANVLQMRFILTIDGCAASY